MAETIAFPLHDEAAVALVEKAWGTLAISDHECVRVTARGLVELVVHLRDYYGLPPELIEPIVQSQLDKAACGPSGEVNDAFRACEPGVLAAVRAIVEGSI